MLGLFIALLIANVRANCITVQQPSSTVNIAGVNWDTYSGCSGPDTNIGSCSALGMCTSGVTKEACAQKCKDSSDCGGFGYEMNSPNHCWLKPTLSASSLSQTSYIHCRAWAAQHGYVFHMKPCSSNSAAGSISMPPYFSYSGDCDASGACVSSKNFPNYHGNYESCTITMTNNARLIVHPTFSTEYGYDILKIRGVDMQNHKGWIPSSLNAGDVIEWSTDVSHTHVGWKICFTEPAGFNRHARRAYTSHHGNLAVVTPRHNLQQGSSDEDIMAYCQVACLSENICTGYEVFLDNYGWPACQLKFADTSCQYSNGKDMWVRAEKGDYCSGTMTENSVGNEVEDQQENALAAENQRLLRMNQALLQAVEELSLN